jgi:hypothetical protein
MKSVDVDLDGALRAALGTEAARRRLRELGRPCSRHLGKLD